MLVLKQIFVVGVGGALGAIARYKLGGFILHRTGAWDFPLSTFCVNLIGCLVIGVLAAVVEHHDFFAPATRLFLFTGLLGGFTTVSAFGYEGMFLLRRALRCRVHLRRGSVIGGFAAVWLGMKSVFALAGRAVKKISVYRRAKPPQFTIT